MRTVLTGPECLGRMLWETERKVTNINLPAVYLEGSQQALKKTSNQPASNLVNYPYSRQPKVREKSKFSASLWYCFGCLMSTKVIILVVLSCCSFGYLMCCVFICLFIYFICWLLQCYDRGIHFKEVPGGCTHFTLCWSCCAGLLCWLASLLRLQIACFLLHFSPEKVKSVNWDCI